MATKKVQLKTQGGDLLMPATLSELILDQTETTLIWSNTKTGTTSSYFTSGQKSPPFAQNTEYRMVVSSSVSRPASYDIRKLEGSTNRGKIATMPAGAEDFEFTFNTGAYNINKFTITAKQVITWTIKVYLDTKTSLNDRIQSLEQELEDTNDEVEALASELSGTDVTTIVDKDDDTIAHDTWIPLGTILQANTKYRMTITSISKQEDLADSIITRLTYSGQYPLTMSPNANTTPGAVTTWEFTTGRTYNRLNFVNNGKTFAFHVKIERINEWTLKGLVDENTEDIEELKGEIDPTFYQKAMLLNSGCVQVKPLLCNDKNIMHVHIGSSTSAWQASENLAPEGVCEVPATCDRQGLAYGLWVNSVFGNPKYRRYDYGKKSLVGDYSDKWTDDLEAFFTETGTWNSAYGNFTNAASSRTTLDTQVSPIPFDSAGSNRHIPERYSNGAGASVSFTVPAGYTRFSFIFVRNILGDGVTVSVSRGSGVVTMADNIDMDDAVEANGGTFSTLYTGSSEFIGYPNQMMHFAISDTTEATTVTITKSSDTTKYLIWWGIVYWGTTSNPYAHIFANNSLGGANLTTIWSHHVGCVGALSPDITTYQLTTTNNITSDTPNYATITANLKTAITRMATYCSGINSEIAYVLQQIPPERATEATGLYSVRDIFSCLVRHIEDSGYILLGNMDWLMRRIQNTYYPSLTYAEFIALVSADTKHMNTEGLSIWRALFNSINN